MAELSDTPLPLAPSHLPAYCSVLVVTSKLNLGFTPLHYRPAPIELNVAVEGTMTQSVMTPANVTYHNITTFTQQFLDKRISKPVLYHGNESKLFLLSNILT